MGGHQCDMYYFINVKKVYFHIKRHPSTRNYASSCSIHTTCDWKNKNYANQGKTWRVLAALASHAVVFGG